MSLKAIRTALWVVVAAVVAVGVAWFAFAPREGALTTANIGGPFTLTDQNGATVTEAALKGHPTAMFFGYTFCPDVCPTTLSDITVWLQQLGAGGDRLKVYFVTVDPERDTQAAMASYLQAFDPRIVGLTGTRPAIDAMLKEFRVYARKVDGKDGAPYTMDHTAGVYLLDSNANFVGTVDYQEKPDVALAKLKRLIGET
ncbi:MAG TPA: SCO family protein [Bauldia sp.]|nr:SCO family protein [Bauldia sp.]